MPDVMMECGHRAQGVVSGKPVCVICYGDPRAVIVKEKPPLDNRKAKCTYCKNETASSISLPFFEHRPAMEKDGYYCGCKGWN